jgi:hypothetical protein
MSKYQKDIENRQLNAFLGSTAGITAAATFSTLFAATNPVTAIALLSNSFIPK